MTSVSIVDYGVGNIASIRNMFRQLGLDSKVVSSYKDIASADRIVLPGIGSFDSAVDEIEKRNMREPLVEFATASDRPFLGVCLGMQLLLDSSEEGTLPGLGLIGGTNKKFVFPAGTDLAVPHMGWNYLEIQNPNYRLGRSFNGDRFYFVHSYHAVPNVSEHQIYSTDYGYKFSSVIGTENIIGVQFHPEKSHLFGLKLLKEFSLW